MKIKKTIFYLVKNKNILQNQVLTSFLLFHNNLLNGYFCLNVFCTSWHFNIHHVIYIYILYHAHFTKDHIYFIILKFTLKHQSSCYPSKMEKCGDFLLLFFLNEEMLSLDDLMWFSWFNFLLYFFVSDDFSIPALYLSPW